ncbi:hypothetical protein KO116_02458 [Halomonas sp. KO116]|nr:hypothetical protein KO116_02458 [Halomonas sp. KO116]
MLLPRQRLLILLITRKACRLDQQPVYFQFGVEPIADSISLTTINLVFHYIFLTPN